MGPSVRPCGVVLCFIAPLEKNRSRLVLRLIDGAACVRSMHYQISLESHAPVVAPLHTVVPVYVCAQYIPALYIAATGPPLTGNPHSDTSG